MVAEKIVNDTIKIFAIMLIGKAKIIFKQSGINWQYLDWLGGDYLVPLILQILARHFRSTSSFHSHLIIHLAHLIISYFPS